MSSLTAWVSDRRRGRSVRAAAWGLVLLFGALATAADPRQSFSEGLRAAEAKDWKAVAEHMRAALDENPEPGGKVRVYGSRYETYLPYFYLGRALYEIEAYREAAVALTTSARYGKVEGRRRAELDRMLEECLEKYRDSPPLTPPTGPPAELRAAADAFFRGEYGQTLDLLAASHLTGARVRATASLLSAAARYSLFLQGERRDDELRNSALADVARCRQEDPSIEPDPAIFSPAFVRFFESARGEP